MRLEAFVSVDFATELNFEMNTIELCTLFLWENAYPCSCLCAFVLGLRYVLVIRISLKTNPKLFSRRITKYSETSL